MLQLYVCAAVAVLAAAVGTLHTSVGLGAQCARVPAHAGVHNNEYIGK